MRITMIMGNTPKVDIGRTRPLRYESAGRPAVPERPCDERTHACADRGYLPLTGSSRAGLGPGQADFSRGVRRVTSRGTIVGLTFSSTASRVMTTRSTSLRLGTSYITDWRTSFR